MGSAVAPYLEAARRAARGDARFVNTSMMATLLGAVISDGLDDGRVVSGANIENASDGVTLCAECSMVSELFATGGGRLVAVWCVDGTDATVAILEYPPTV